MKAVIQKSGHSNVKVDGKIVGEIQSGLVILLGINTSDTETDIDYLIEKIANLRLFENEGKYFEQSVLEKAKDILVISQFTLYADTKKGRRPDFNAAAKSEIAKPLYEKFIKKLEEKGIKVETGIFGAEMEVNITNQGPITIIIESENR